MDEEIATIDSNDGRVTIEIGTLSLELDPDEAARFGWAIVDEATILKS